MAGSFQDTIICREEIKNTEELRLASGFTGFAILRKVKSQDDQVNINSAIVVVRA